jgi:hypothetical protein
MELDLPRLWDSREPLGDGLGVHGLLGHGDHLGAPRQAHIQGDEARMPPHDLYEEDPLVAGGGVPDAVNGLQGRVDGGVKADGIVGAKKVVVNGARHPHHGDLVLLNEAHGPAEGAVAADGHQALYPRRLQLGHRLGPPLLGEELLAPGGEEDGPSPLQDVGHVPHPQGDHLPLDHAGVAPADADDLNAHGVGLAHHGPDGRVHAGGVAPAGKDADALHLSSMLRR